MGNRSTTNPNAPQAQNKENPVPSENTERQSALSQARAAATKRVLEEHADTFATYMIEESKARGQEWSPRLNDEQRAEQEFERLLRTHPHLAARLKEVEAQA